MYRIELAPSAAKAFDKLPAALQKRIERKIDALTRTPRPADCKKLQGEDSLYRVRVGDYRTLYEIEDGRLLILIMKIAHRQHSYKL